MAVLVVSKEMDHKGEQRQLIEAVQNDMVFFQVDPSLEAFHNYSLIKVLVAPDSLRCSTDGTEHICLIIHHLTFCLFSLRP